jgi:hypothetical protein
VAKNYDANKILNNRKHLLKCNLITFEAAPAALAGEYTNSNHSRIELPGMYVGKPCAFQQTKTADFAMVARLHPERSNFQTRRDICKWLQKGNYSISACGKVGAQCPALALAKYGFHARGDTWGSNRLIALLLSGTVPLFTDEAQYHILPDFLPWKELSHLVNVSSFDAFGKSLDAILNLPSQDYEEKLRLIAHYRDLVDHTSHVVFDRYMAEFAIRLNLQE